MPDRTRAFDLAVVGGGVIGLAVAWRAARCGLRSVVLERGDPGSGTSRYAAGMLAPVSEADPAEQPLLGLGLASARGYREFAAELAQASGRDPGLLESGTLLLARDRDEAEALERQLSMRQALGLEVRRLLPSQARELEPALAPALRLALEVPHDHVVDPRKLTSALADAVVRAGAELRRDAEVDSVIVQGDRIHGVSLRGGEQVLADQVVLALGVWSSQVDGLPPCARVPVHPVKGQIIGLRDPSGPGLVTRVLRMDGGYLVPRGDGRYVLGATVEERGFDTTVTARAVFELLRDAIELVPGVDELTIEELSAGLRPRTPDNAPAIGPGGLPGLHWATGHYRNGILLAPITAEIVVAGLRGEALPELAADFAPGRFTNVTVQA